ncbi:Plasmodium variant antigen protein Cir/Yir/Bir, putative [Plasmodium chabaudi adami]|uniref:Plasmodium variant antigen protein Cir/Yir/Bir, putative n=1 Tax=Plasmodium chabaudi adami TaxID=5826 RepID=A0A1D3LA41_PLACE|nr:Plasmodium variant antigen protein Cir/Yir/Bir, putative [Plasmodium chabaudi adami]
MSDQLCKLLIDVDEYFNNGIADVTKFNKSDSCKKYCPYENGKPRDCKDNYERINALGEYLYQNLPKNHKEFKDEGIRDNLHIEFFMMWLSDKIFKVNKDYKATLKESYEKHLNDITGNFEYWDALKSKEAYKDATIVRMSNFHSLLNSICKTINENNNNPDVENLKKYADQCLSLYRSIHKSSIDDEENGKNPPTNLQSTQCIGLPKKPKTGNQVKPTLSAAVLRQLQANRQRLKVQKKPQSRPQPPPTNQAHRSQQGQQPSASSGISTPSPDTTKLGTPPSGTQVSPGAIPLGASTPTITTATTSGTSTTTSAAAPLPGTSSLGTSSSGIQNGVVNNPKDPNGGTSSQQTNQDAKQVNQKGDPGVKSDVTDDQGSSDSQGGGAATTKGDADIGGGGGASVDKGKPSGVSGGGASGDKGRPSDVSGSSVNVHGNPNGVVGDSGGGSDSGSGAGLGSVQGGAAGGSGISQQGINGGAGSQGGTDPNQGSIGNGGGGGPKVSGDQDAANSPGTFNGYWSSNWGSRFNLLNYLPSASEIYESQKSILTSAGNKISNAYSTTVSIAKNAYGSAVTAVKNTYNSAVTNINYAYDTSTNYIGGVVNSVASQLNPFGASTSGDNQSGPGGAGSGSSTGSSPSNPPQIPNSDPNLSPLPSSPPVITPSPLPTSSSTQPTISHPQSGTTQGSSQITGQNGGSDPVQGHDTNPGTGISKALTNSSTDQSNTGNGITTGTVVKTNEKPSIWCIAPNKKCDLVGISVIGVSISIFLAIMYKYLSFGQAKNSKKEKNMKRVINSTSGKKQIQIIIKSSTQKKQTKKYIKPVYREKSPLLNIYKLMQADPMPFIN